MNLSWESYFFNICEEVRRKSKDHSVKVGCIIAGPDHEIRSTGFNGFPRGVKETVESDLSDYDKASLLYQFNVQEIKKRHIRPEKYLWTEHAERNAIFAAARVGIPLKGCEIYVDWIPCADCARAIIQSGIAKVIVDGRKFEEKWGFWKERWQDHMRCSIQMFEESGVELNIWEGVVQYDNSQKHLNLIKEALHEKDKEKK